ncbi:hypothetical protein J5N97_004310 [Dioscorea zingiberensis]|uniref:Uncharacterized protein n=1 Tax=Dioscorea zingiberensis TaxID=325984 RepID=A0A9D5HR93_9LILI|nr:hypothetical protein J5N97_004310 [Dioscorea zingiberensis]
MGKEPLPQRQSSNYLYGCMGSPTWFPANRQQHQHSKFHLLRHAAGASINGGRSRSWREALKRFIKEGRNFYSSKPITFGYDAVSYSKNFDDGCWKEGPATSSSSSSSLRRSTFDDFECQLKAC